MGDPARQLEPEDSEPTGHLKPAEGGVYDAPGGSPSQPGLTVHPGGGESTPRKKDHLNVADDTPNRGDIANKEAEGVTGAPDTASNNEKSLFNPRDDFTTPGGRVANIASWLFTKKKAAGGSIVALIAGGIVFLFSIGQGPLQLVHLSQILQKNFFGTEQSSSIRMKGLFRYHRTGDIGETRVTKLGSEVFKKTVTKLEGIGFDFSDRNKINGHLRSITIDASKHPAFKDMPASERRAALLRHFEISDDSTLTRKGSLYKINLDATTARGVNFANSAVNTALGDLQDGKIVTGMGLRSMKKFYNLPRLFSPLEKRVSAAENKIATKAERKKAEEDRNEKTRGPVSAKAATARANLKEKLSSNQGKLSGALITTQALCLVREVADDVVMVNRYEIVLPSVLQAVDKTAVGAQVQSGKNLDAQQAGQVSESFIDEDGKSIFGGRALQALSGDPKPSGEEISDDYKQAFSNETTAQKLKDGIGSPKALGVDLGAVTCSTPGLIVQGGLSVALLAAGPVTLGGSWGVFAAKAGTGAAATAGVTYLLKNQLVKLLASDAIVPKVFSGPIGGNLLAYGGREAGNIGARASGGIALSASSAAAIDKQQQFESQKEFAAKSFANRVFDVNDHRSLAGSLIDRSSSDPSQNVTNIASGLTNVSSLVSNLFSAFMPKTYANETSYDWAFPKFEIPRKILINSKYENPYDNADKVAALLNSGDGRGYIERAKKCFGVSIGKDSGIWNVIAEEEVNPNDESYINAKCDNTSDENWIRILLFVKDTRDINSAACYEGDTEVCEELHVSSAGGSSSEDSAGEAASGSVNVDDLGKSSDKISCAEGTKDLGVVTSKYTGEFKKESGPMKIRLCQIADIPGQGNDTKGNLISGGAVVEARVSGAWAALAKKAKADGVKLSSSSSFRLADSCGGTGDGTGCARPGQSAHQTGWAIDFADMGGFSPSGSYTSCAGRMTNGGPQWKWMKENAEDFGIKQYSAESWHWDFLPMANRCGK